MRMLSDMTNSGFFCSAMVFLCLLAAAPCLATIKQAKFKKVVPRVAAASLTDWGVTDLGIVPSSLACFGKCAPLEYCSTYVLVPSRDRKYKCHASWRSPLWLEAPQDLAVYSQLAGVGECILGPYGATSHTFTDASFARYGPITSIELGKKNDQFFSFRAKFGSEWGHERGGYGDSEQFRRFTFAADEYITGVDGYYGPDHVWGGFYTTITVLQITTNQRSMATVGTASIGDTDFTTRGRELVYLSGYHGGAVVGLRFHYSACE